MIPAPFKCVGGKAKMVENLRSLLPPTTDFVGYAEPFVGGGAFFRYLRAHGFLDQKQVRLSDAGKGTVRTWQDIQRNAGLVESKLAAYEYTYNSQPTEDARKQQYYAERDIWNSGAITGARHIFLRKLAFNGLWRVNKRGGFNVPWGRYKRFVAPEVRLIAAALQDRVEIFQASFTEAFASLDGPWLVYVDPPYLEEFDQYTPERFALPTQIRLLQCCAEAKQAGMHVLYSNRHCPEVIDLIQQHWPDATVQRAVRQQTVAAKSTSRGAVEELVAT